MRDGAIGQPRVMRGAFLFVLDRPEDVRWDPAMGGGALYDVGCYPLDLMRQLTGRAAPTCWQPRRATPIAVWTMR